MRVWITALLPLVGPVIGCAAPSKPDAVVRPQVVVNCLASFPASRPEPPPPFFDAATASVDDASVAPADDGAPHAPPALVASATGDLDGDGIDESIRLLSDGALRVFHGDQEVTDGERSPAGQLPDFEEISQAHYHDYEYPLQVVDIDRRDRQRELMLIEIRGDEDPPRAYSFWVYRDRRFWPMLRRYWSDDHAVFIPPGSRPRIAGDGAVRFEFGRCVRDANAERNVRGIEERTALQYTLTDGWMPRAELMESVRASRRPSDCIQAACPMVYVGARPRLVGEILRELRSEGLEQWQPLTLPPSSVDVDGTLTVTLREEKREVTHLDDIYVEADGRRVLPDGCDRGAERWCGADGARALLPPGRSLALRFRVGGPRALTLWARGYYVPFDAP